MEEPKRLHIALFPWLAFGHLLPYQELAKQIAQRGHKISFISTPRNIQRLPKIPSNLSSLINLVSLTLPHVENLPNDAEATSDVPSRSMPYLKIAFDGLQDSLAQFLKISTPDWIICDFAPHWLPPIAAKLGISLAHFSIIAGWSVSFFAPSTSALINGEDLRTEPEQFTVPPKWIPFPSKVAYRLHEARQIVSSRFQVNKSGISDMSRLGHVLAGCDLIALRSCMELEADFVRLVGDLHGKPAVPIGLLATSAEDGKGDSDETWLTISDWLDKQNKESVVYVALGSESGLNKDEITELALGMELSGLPFLWALRKQQENSSVQSETFGLPDGFEEKVKGRGLVWTTWVPQLKVLAHPSIGGFLTHCGYGSVLEALAFGRALIMLPFNIIDQGLTARVFEEQKVGIEIPRKEDGRYTRDAVAESTRLVVVDKEGTVYRENAMQMKKLFQDKGLQDRYMNHFIEILQNHRLNPGPADLLSNRQQSTSE